MAIEESHAEILHNTARLLLSIIEESKDICRWCKGAKMLTVMRITKECPWCKGTGKQLVGIDIEAALPR